jgi:hypothetical protein
MASRAAVHWGMSSEMLPQRVAPVIELDDPITEEEREAAMARVRATVAGRPSREAIAAWWVSAEAIPAPAFRNASGRLDASLLAPRLGVPLEAMGRVVHPPVPASVVLVAPDAPALQWGLAAVARVVDDLDVLLPDPASQQAWLWTRVPRLQRRRPLDLILRGQGERVASLLGILRDGAVD